MPLRRRVEGRGTVIRQRVMVGLMVAGLGCQPTSDPGDVRADARIVLQAALETSGSLTVADLFEGPSEVPTTIRVWRRSIGAADTSCEGQVEELGLEQYVRGVLPEEWIASWDANALEAGAIVIRTYAAFWVAVGGKYKCADIDDTTWTQVYRQELDRRTDAAVSETEGAVVRRDGSLVYAEYSAENGHRTRFDVVDAPCKGESVRGHGRGMCQWGTQRWALLGKDAAWMIRHYYPGARIVWPDEERIDGTERSILSGESFELSLSVTNTDTQPWPAGSVRVGTEPCAFADSSWKQPTQPAVLESVLAPNETATLTWTMRAPVVSEPMEYAEFFYLDGPASNRPGSSGSWRITVLSPKPPVATWSPRPAGALLGAGGLFLLALLGWLGWRPRTG